MQILPTKTPNQSNIKQTYLTFSKIYGKNRQEEVRRKPMRNYSIGREELKGVKMAKELTTETRTTNRFLHDIEQWRETDVNDYKRKVGFELSEAWTEAIIIFALMFTVFGYVWALIATALPKTMNGTAKGCIAFAIYIIFTAAAAYVMSGKNLKKFVSGNRGEVGHKGEP